MSVLNKYQVKEYIKILKEENNSKASIVLEVEGIFLYCRGSSRGISYFECSSHRLRNTAICNFRGRIKDFDQTLINGEIEIIQEHSESCQFLPGNSVNDFKKSNLALNKLVYKKMKIEVEKKLEEENWLSPGELLNWINKSFPVDSHLNYQQIDQIVQN